ncbi:Bacterial dynamin-like protein [Bacillus sp. THAF10]|uniref:dynamin family protein n=1 Tax=Bacillus sp. THAF10 TaxID=2587848 RepID=UPI0012A8AFE9|nr:dynamin family protein [Bacillus sp. THAF10]QFT89332.1 Bacterial dynamin-like protein [Bacillus sp. THAF10]
MGTQKQNHIKQINERLFLKLSSILEVLHNRKDEKGARKVAELYQKAQEEELTIAFCGHFSAGKSSFINEILDEKILPASPIPTSANVVKIRKGPERAYVNFFKGESLEIMPPVTFELVKAYCKDGDHVETVEYQYPFERLPEDLVVLDTPGVDSTDDAHRLSTESALHLADVIFYVMDYNHVQSEVNLKFIKELQEKEKKIYLIVNQIDKHREEELSFSTYTKRIHDSFHDWGLQPASVYYTSLQDKEHALNDLSIVKETIQILRQDKVEILPKTIDKALEQVVAEHRTWLFEQKEQEIQQNEALINNYEGEMEDVPSLYSEMSEKLVHLEAKTSKIKEEFILETKRILDNANITPFEMRELAEKFLESRQKGFKVGLIFSGKKTEEEKELRSHAFRHDLETRVQTQMDKFLQEHVMSFLKEQEFYHSLSFEEVQRISVPINVELIAGHVKQGAGYTGNAVLNYTKDLAHTIKVSYQKNVQTFMETYFEKLDDREKEKFTSIKEQVEHLRLIQEAQNKISSLYLLLEQEYEMVMDLWNENSLLPQTEESFQLVTNYTEKNYSKIRGDKLPSQHTKLTRAKEKDDVPKSVLQQKDGSLLIKQIEEACEIVSDIPGFQTISQDLRRRSAKLKDQTFTVALFGAFSAGKSSLANALFGEKVLPVSPNPTTASINKISPVTSSNPHGTVHVMVKTEEQILNDIQQAFTIFNQTVTSLQEAIQVMEKIIKKNDHIQLDSSQKPQFQFLKAFLMGYDEMKGYLGSRLTVTLDVFEDYVAKEEKSCFVEWIEVFYDCPFTQQGLTLVDTPGADSINSRHTDVSFEFIKNADAILFVTYYQHAFSKADREFLIQLGRVKDAFAMDKMFFLVNAADLANNEEELQLVSNYVEDQLITYGIRHPRLYPVSSLLALKEKQGESVEHPFLQGAYIQEFEEAFSDFIQSDLKDMSIHAAQLDLNRAADILTHYVNQAKLGEHEKEALIQRYNRSKEEIKNTVELYSNQSFSNLLEKEIQELIYYVKQRTVLRFTDFFKESFNPAVLREDGRNIKEQLSLCLKELGEDIFYNLSQEVRATTVRVENYISNMLEGWQMEMEKDAQNLESTCSLRKMEMENFPPFKVDKTYPPLSTKLYKQTAGFYRNAKSFFEKNEKQKMLIFLEEQFSPLMDSYLQENKEQLHAHYQKELEQAYQEVKNYLLQQVQEFFDGMQSALEQKQDIAKLELLQKKMEAFKK